MGRIIANNAGIEDMLDDVAITLVRCRKRGGVWETQGTTFLGDVVVLADRSSTELDQSDKERTNLVSARDVALSTAHRVVGRVYDDLWNDLERPAVDPFLAILFPGGADCVDEEKIADRADTMDAIATTLATVGHPRLPKERTTAAAETIRAEAARLRAAVATANQAVAVWTVHRKVRRALGLVGQAQLSSLKLALRSLRFREAQIHEVIPDRPRGAAAAAPAADPAPDAVAAESPDPEPAEADLPDEG
jgi:hypothetical protein